MFFRNGMLVMTADDYITREEDRCIGRQTDKDYRDAEMHLYRNIIGNYIAVRSINDGDTRVFIYGEDITDDMSKNGWFKTFTISDTPMQKGIWIARFNEPTYDANWHLNFHVTPKKFLGGPDSGERLFTDKGWGYFANKGILNMVTVKECYYQNEFSVFDKFCEALGITLDKDPSICMSKYIREYRDIFPRKLFEYTMDGDTFSIIKSIGDAYNQPYEIEKAIDQISNIRFLMNSDYPGILNTDRNICNKFAHDIQYDHPYANAKFIVNETERKCLERLDQKDANKQKKSDLKKAMNQYHKEIKKIAAAHLNKNYEPSSMKDYQESLNKARSACKKGSPDIEIIMEELRIAVQNLKVLT